jgi:uncharacterized protein YozE (UPF0346 family)
MNLTFKEWLLNFVNASSEISTFANEVAQDPFFPEENDFHIIFEYVMAKTRNQIEPQFLAIWEMYSRGL